MIHANPNYTVACSGSDQERAFGDAIAREFGLAPQVGEILFSRNIDTLEKAKEFLCPQLSMLPPPESMKGMREAVACILATCDNDQPIFIHGDYDVDGISATALLVSFFRELGRQTYSHIPNRLQESYGLSIDSIDRLIAQRPGQGGVLISVDCGISAVAEVAYARQRGLRVVITDHHEPRGVLPDADAILDPKQPGCNFPYSTLAGVGVAFYLLMALRKAMGIRINLKQYLDLVALGTVADVVPLTGVNRILVRAGLEVLTATDRPGLLSLYSHAGMGKREILSEDIAYKLAPRINAAGRLGQPETGLALLLANDMESAQNAASTLEQMNSARKQLEIDELASAEAVCAEQVEAGRNGLVVYQPQCHAGVLGILASRLVDKHQRPVLVFADEHKGGAGGIIRGSGRSVKGINLFQILTRCDQWIEQFGGHAMAIGLTIKQENLESFADDFNQNIGMLECKLQTMNQVWIDYCLPNASMLTDRLMQAVQRLQPFGEGNPEPIFLLPEQQLIAPKKRNGHLMFHLQGQGRIFPGIGFHLGQPHLDTTKPADVLFRLKRSWFRGVERNQLQATMLVSS
ncbi:MAG: single-stranded-DNA-specific exonuclease RecJ [Desulfobulbus sp.]|jgi:single-stranded-DNA-specific exonuclease|uniref:single-stranded-DNA-specific exonuclease RecJ n=1 Tax=Desulfobulbus sp. TaxID=895 RepID=UPI00284B7196|nr:single-stranded-DNA-specific exonuclease RecJ [Desulfobulbus sp.]MDR2549272.1 single-stranded-DNA-specific exonuclease RecJ [Desulfobulbus sp.]